MHKRILAGIFLAIFFTVGEVNAQCEGQIRQIHSQPGYTFETTSRTFGNGRYHVYETCVENRSDRALDFNWYVPGPHSWVPANGHLPHPREFNTRGNEEVTDACLRYGNLWMYHSARFEPHPSDMSRVRAENGDCEGRVSRESHGYRTDPLPGSSTNTVSSLDSEVQVYGPAYSSSPDRTLVKFSIHTQIRPSGQNSTYLHELSIQSEPHGDLYFPQSFRLIPPLRMLREAYNSLGYSQGILPLDGRRSFRLELETPNTPQLRSIRFRIYNGNNHHVATAFIPFWLDG